MPAFSINMHGKRYSLLDEIVRNQEQAKSEAQKQRDNGKVAFLNPRKRKDMETTYYIYTAEKAVRKKKEPKPITPKKLTQELDNQSNLSESEVDEFISGGVQNDTIDKLEESDVEEAIEALQEIEEGHKICPICNTTFKPKNSRQIYDKKPCQKIAKAQRVKKSKK